LNSTPPNKIDIDKLFELVMQDVRKSNLTYFQLWHWSLMQVGTLPRKDFFMNGIFDEELFAEIREKKLATLLATEVLEGEHAWLNYEFEESQVKIDLGDMILEHLVSETIEIMDAVS
jgi:hypothetical protein